MFRLHGGPSTPSSRNPPLRSSFFFLCTRDGGGNILSWSSTFSGIDLAWLVGRTLLGTTNGIYVAHLGAKGSRPKFATKSLETDDIYIPARFRIITTLIFSPTLAMGLCANLRGVGRVRRGSRPSFFILFDTHGSPTTTAPPRPHRQPVFYPVFIHILAYFRPPRDFLRCCWLLLLRARACVCVGRFSVDGEGGRARRGGPG